jgi:hypothetical protein
MLRGVVLGYKENLDCFDACFFDEKQKLRGGFCRLYPDQVGIAPHPRFTEGECGWGVEKSQINLLLTFINNVGLYPINLKIWFFSRWLRSLRRLAMTKNLPAAFNGFYHDGN